jgi:phage regulator Rha-like protein
MDKHSNAISHNNAVTMSSREIAELTGKRHPDVKRDIEKMLTELSEDVSKFAHIYIDSMNREQSEYLLDRDLTENLLLGYSPVLRRKVLQRMREMEALLSEPRIPTTAEAFASAFQMLADTERRHAVQQAEIKAIDARVDIIEQTTPLKAKPQNAESTTEIRKRMNAKYGLPPHVVDFVLNGLPYSFRPFGMVKNSHEDAQGSSYAVYWIRDVSDLFKRFVGECMPVTATSCTHPHIGRRFKLTKTA